MLDLKPKIEVHKDISKSFECRFCHKLFSQKWILNSHSNFKHQKEDHKCDFCDEIFSFSNSYDLHVQKKHKGLQIFYCDDCDKSFQYQKKFVKHSKTCKPAIIPKKCEVCGVVSDKDFEDFKIFAKHVKTCGVVVQTEKKCDICGEKFNHGNALRNHKLKCGVVETKEKCDQCYLEFSQLELLKNHVINFHDGKTHNNTRRISSKYSDPKQKFHKCMFCEKSYRSQHDLTGHILGLHEGDPDYKCKFCGLICIRIADLKKHLKRKHDGDGCINSNPAKPDKTAKEEIVCKICKSSFSNKSKRNFHMKKCRVEKKDSNNKESSRSLLRFENAGFRFKREIDGNMFKTVNPAFVQETMIKAVKTNDNEENKMDHREIENNFTEKIHREIEKYFTEKIHREIGKNNIMQKIPNDDHPMEYSQFDVTLPPPQLNVPPLPPPNPIKPIKVFGIQLSSSQKFATILNPGILSYDHDQNNQINGRIKINNLPSSLPLSDAIVVPQMKKVHTSNNSNLIQTSFKDIRNFSFPAVLSTLPLTPKIKVQVPKELSAKLSNEKLNMLIPTKKVDHLQEEKIFHQVNHNFNSSRNIIGSRYGNNDKHEHNQNQYDENLGKFEILEQKFRENNKNMVICTICHETFKDNSSIENHWKIIHVKKLMSNSCLHCSTSALSQLDLIKHFRLVHLGLEKKVEEESTSSTNLFANPDIEKPYLCTICTQVKRFQTMESIEQHWEQVHMNITNKEQHLRCVQCQRNFPNDNFVISHFRQFHLGMRKLPASGNEVIVDQEMNSNEKNISKSDLTNFSEDDERCAFCQAKQEANSHVCDGSLRYILG